MRNLGPESTLWLASVGVRTEEDLYELGAVEAFLRVRAAHPEKVSFNLLWALQGALLDLPWNELPPEMKDDLRQQVEAAG